MLTSRRLATMTAMAVLSLSAFGCAQQEDSPGAVTKQAPLLAAAGTAASNSPDSSTETVLYTTSTATVVQDGDWIRWHFAAPLSSVTTTLIYRGTRNADDACGFTGGTTSATIDPSQPSEKLEREIGINMNQCLLEMEQAQVPVASAPDMSASTGHSPVVSSGAEGGPDLQLEDGYSYTGFYDQYMIDILGIRVTQQTSHVDWSSSGNCISGWHRYSASDPYWESGWTVSLSYDTGTPGGTGNCNIITESSFGAFVNYPFCFATATDVYANVTFNAYPYNSSGTWSTYVTGLCASWLSYQTQYKSW